MRYKRIGTQIISMFILICTVISLLVLPIRADWVVSGGGIGPGGSRFRGLSFFCCRVFPAICNPFIHAVALQPPPTAIRAAQSGERRDVPFVVEWLKTTLRRQQGPIMTTP